MSGEIRNRTVYMLYRTDGGNDVYIGSTSYPLGKRFSHHKQNAGNPSRLEYYGSSKLYQKMREIGVCNWKIVPLLTFACNRETICEFEQEWVNATGANLNMASPVNEDVNKKEYNRRYYKKNKGTQRFHCNVCNVTCRDNSGLKKHLGTLKHSYAWLNSLD